jgi:hypothetical protein
VDHALVNKLVHDLANDTSRVIYGNTPAEREAIRVIIRRRAGFWSFWATAAFAYFGSLGPEGVSLAALLPLILYMFGSYSFPGVGNPKNGGAGWVKAIVVLMCMYDLYSFAHSFAHGFAHGFARTAHRT